jgi:hypothetical protein
VIDDDRLDVLVLVRIGRGKTGTPAAKIRDALRPLLEHELAPAEAARRIEARTAALAGRGLVASQGKTWRLTDAGVAHVKGALGRVPTWANVGGQLAAKALGITATGADAQLGALVADRLGVPAAKTAMAAADAAIQRRLGMAPGTLTLKALRAHVLASAGAGKGDDPALLARRLAAGALRTTADARSIRRALVQRWLGPTAATSAPAPASPPATAPPLADFAAAARAAAARAEGRFGKKAFVAAVWRELTKDARFAALTLDRAKQLLVAANRDGLVELTRADLVAAMDPALVAASQIDDLGSTFHFVTSDGDGTGG